MTTSILGWVLFAITSACLVWTMVESAQKPTEPAEPADPATEAKLTIILDTLNIIRPEVVSYVRELGRARFPSRAEEMANAYERNSSVLRIIDQTLGAYQNTPDHTEITKP